jgi:hypothetical protein
MLSVYVLAQLKPLSVVIKDVIDHTFFKMQHMATVHYENGKYHLHKELASSSEEDNRDRGKISVEKIIDFTHHLPLTITFTMAVLPRRHLERNDAVDPTRGYGKSIYQPPRLYPIS